MRSTPVNAPRSPTLPRTCTTPADRTMPPGRSVGRSTSRASSRVGRWSFFLNYSYVKDFIPGKNQGASTVPANAKHLAGDFSDLLTLPNPEQYRIYDPLSVHRDPSNPNRFIRDPFPNNVT